MRKFSERLGVVSPRDVFQRESIDQRLRNRLWSACDRVFWSNLYYATRDGDSYTDLIVGSVQDQFFGNTIDSLRHYTSENIAAFGRWYQSAKWNEVYDFIQFLGDFSTQTGQGPDRARARQEGSQFQLAANEVLSEEKSAYRFVSGELCEVTDEVEIRAIESVSSVDGRFAGAKTHIQRALAHFASRDSPDYRNSVKESISAVESVYSIVNGRRSGSMIEAIRVAEVKGFVLHPALKKGILSLYGWTSDEAGVRHSLFDGTGSVTSAQAKFVVVICSALVNFLIEESGGK